MQRLLISLPILMCTVIVTETTNALVVPGALNPGDFYHLAFVTDGRRHAQHSKIKSYNAFVNAEAARSAPLTGAKDGVQWFAIGSTLTENARDNAVVGADVPVYLMNGTTKIADGFNSMWDGDIDFRVERDQFNIVVPSLTYVWTGSTPIGTTKDDGSFHGGGALGETTANLGLVDANVFPGEWIDYTSEYTILSNQRLYALSQQIIVDPAACDFNSDGSCGLVDINLMFSKGDLVAGVATNPSTDQYDLIDNNIIDNADITEWLSMAGSENGYSSAYLHGDTDHLDTTHPDDRTVDITDFQNFLDGFTGVGSTWELGNFNGDGVIDITDFSNFFIPSFVTTNGGAYGPGQSIPEPAAALLLGLGALLLAYASRSRIGRN